MASGFRLWPFKLGHFPPIRIVVVSYRCRVRGLTLIEVMVAVIFLGLCVSSILSCISVSSQRMREVEQRQVVLSYMQSQMETLASTSRKTPPAALNTTTNITLNGISQAVSVNKKASLVVGTTDLYFLDITANWNVTASKTNRSQTLRLSTYVRSPYG